MPIPKLEATNRYIIPEVTKTLLVPVIANYVTGATRIELNAGLDISDEIAAYTGWAVSGAMVATPDAGSRFVSSINGRLTAAESGFTVYADKMGEDLRKELVREQQTNVVFLDGGDVEDGPMDCFKVTCLSLSKPRDLENAMRLDVRFSIQKFVEDLAVPAAA